MRTKEEVIKDLNDTMEYAKDTHSYNGAILALIAALARAEVYRLESEGY